MSSPFASAETFINLRQFAEAADEIRKLRPWQQSSLEALKLSARINAGQGNWGNVDMLCRLIRKDYPLDPFGFVEGAESLHQQGRGPEAAELLRQCASSPLAEEATKSVTV
jgi:hypothetical protein